MRGLAQGAAGNALTAHQKRPLNSRGGAGSEKPGANKNANYSPGQATRSTRGNGLNGVLNSSMGLAASTNEQSTETVKQKARSTAQSSRLSNQRSKGDKRNASLKAKRTEQQLYQQLIENQQTNDKRDTQHSRFDYNKYLQGEIPMPKRGSLPFTGSQPNADFDYVQHHNRPNFHPQVHTSMGLS